MLQLTGYSDRIHARPGESVRFMVSCETPLTYHARIVRIICGDNNPHGPGAKLTHVESPVTGSYQGRTQKIRAGSYVHVPHAAPFDMLESFTVQSFLWPTTPAKGRQAIISKMDANGCGFTLLIDADGNIACEVGDGASKQILASGGTLLPRRWYRVGATYDADTKQIGVFQHPLNPVPGIADDASATEHLKIPLGRSATSLLFAARIGSDDELTDFYNGKIESPSLTIGVLDDATCRTLSGSLPAQLAARIVGLWDFSREMPSQTAFDISKNRLHGAVVNFPARAMTGWNWTGETMDCKEAPEQWGAIHFHDDDIYDAGWTVDFELKIPPDMRSGLYAAHLTAGDSEEFIPFAVGPSPGREQKIAFLLPTASYMAYGNDRLAMDGGGGELLNNVLNIVSPHDIFLNEHLEYGGSLYDAHSDGSGICYSSRLRPLVNMRPFRQGLLGGFGHSKLWQFPADTHITDWLESTGYEFDVITDEALDQHGYQLIAPYKVLITGTHPEYCSGPMWQAIARYRAHGGRLMYLGGDGFYWRVAYHSEYPGIIELRRAESGVRAWRAAPGETFHSFDLRQGGLWAMLGRAPQTLVGVGFSAQGFDICGHYQRLPDSYRPEASFIFEGVGDEPIGNFGLIGGGAAGLEVDRAAPELGTPPNALILAQSRNLTNTYLIVPEEFLETAPGLGADENALARADMVFFTMPNGGAVFSTGSIAWAGSLSHQNYQNNVYKITTNVLRRFLSDQMFDERRKTPKTRNTDLSKPAFYRSQIEMRQFESFLTADGLPAGDVSWLRDTVRDGRTYKAGMWRAGVSACPYYFAADETFVMIEGVLKITLEDGTELVFGPGETGSFELGTHSTWEVIEPVLHFFIQTT